MLKPDSPAQPDQGLRPLETEMLRCAEVGDQLDVGQGPVDQGAMDSGGTRRSIRAAVLRRLLVEDIWPVHAKGVRLRGVRIENQLDLEAATLRCPLRLDNCYLDDAAPVILNYATVSLVSIVECRLAGLTADRLVVTTELSLGGSTITGPVLLRGADITGQLSCRGAILLGTDSDGTALAAQGIKVGSFFLDQGCTAAGAIRLWDATLSGSLICDGARLDGADREGYALLADRMRVGGVVSLVGVCTSAGSVRLWEANIADSLNCGRAQLAGVDVYGNSVFGDGITVGADVLFDDGFTAAATVSLRSAHLAGSLVIRPASLAGRDNAIALDATGVHVEQALHWAPGAPITGGVSLEDAQVGQLTDEWAAAGSRSTGHWPSGGRLRLDGFVYSRISGDAQATGTQRLAWIQAQYSQPTTSGTAAFATQPYEQLASVYRRAGQDKQARQIAIACRRDMRRYGNLTRYHKVINWLLDATIRYGYQTGRAVAGLVLLYLVVLLFFWFARYHGAIVPSQGTGLHPVPTATRCTSRYPCFEPFGFAIDTVVPLINVHQAEFWSSNASVAWGRASLVVTYLGTGFGWLLATLAVAGYTGLVRNVNPDS